MRRGEETWHSVLDRALLTGCGIWIVLQTPTTVTALLRADEAAAKPWLAVALAGRLVLLGLVLHAVRRGATRSLVLLGVVAGVVTIVGAGAAVLLGDLPAPYRLMVPIDALQAAQIFTVAMATRFRTAFAFIVATLPIHLAVHAPGGLTWDTLEQWVTPTSATVALTALVSYLRSGSAYAGQLDAWNREARSRAMAAAGHGAAVRAARRVIHDDVISALRGVEQQAPAADVEAACRAALDALAEHRDCASLDELLASLAAGPDGDVAISVSGVGWSVRPPSRVLEAFRGAAAEALRNVARHGGVRHAEVRTRTDGTELVLEVVDRGRGIAPGTQAGFGLRSSVHAALEQVGGAAQVVATPGGGTTVRLRWTPPQPPPVEQVTPYASDQRWRGYVPVALAIAANSSFLAWRHPGPHGTAALALAGLLVVLLPLAAWRFAFRPPVPRDSLVVAVVVSTLTWLGLEIAGDGALLDMRSWIVGFAGSLTMLLAFDARLREVIVPIAAQIGVMLWFAWQDPTIGLLEPTGALTTPIVIAGFSAVFGALLRRGTALVRQGEATLAARLEEEAWEAAQDRARRVHLDTLRRDVAPFLTDVLTRGATWAAEPAVRAHASMLSLRCRDELLLPRPLPQHVRGSVDTARAAGVVVSFRADENRSWPGELAEVLGHLLAAARPAVVTIIAGDAPRIVVLPRLRRPELVALLRSSGGDIRVEGDGVRTVLHVHVSAERRTVQPGELPASMSG